ncbi:MAG TPA: diguanylate cyclase [Solirubrobacteraceae bacterium]|nr:diguanylate cyclase [Solirubrobacteraceae bacterium]
MSQNSKSDQNKHTESPDRTVEMAAEAILREHPNALVCALAPDGLITPLPKSVQLWGQEGIDGRAMIDHVIAEDRRTVVVAWRQAMTEGLAEAKVRLISAPERWMRLHFVDVRARHGVLVCILVPTEEVADLTELASAQADAMPRFATLIEDESAAVLDCDESFVRMFGFSAEELIGKNVLDQIHPDDQPRAVEGWLAMLSTMRMQQARMRRRRKDGSYLWVDVTMHNFLHDPERRHVLVELIDVSAEMAAQEAVQEREELLRRLMDAMPDGVLHVDRDRHVRFHNARLLDILHARAMPPRSAQGTAAEQEQGGTEQGVCLGELLRTLSEAGSIAFHMTLARVLAEGVDEELEADFQAAQGEWRRALFSFRALRRTEREVNGAIITVLDITDSARARAELERRATFDALTHCLNRSSITAALQRELAGASRKETAVVFVDLDHFKQVNDTLGHAAGDEVLVAVVERLRHATRSEDQIGRLGGDEFLLLIRGVPEPEVAMGVAERISASLREPLRLAGGPLAMVASLGVAWVTGPDDDAESLIARADEAMYRSKAAREGLPVLAA